MREYLVFFSVVCCLDISQVAQYFRHLCVPLVSMVLGHVSGGSNFDSGQNWLHSSLHIVLSSSSDSVQKRLCLLFAHCINA